MLTPKEQQEIMLRVKKLITDRQRTQSRIKSGIVDHRIGRKRLAEQMQAFANYLKGLQ